MKYVNKHAWVLIVPDTLENRPYGWSSTSAGVTARKLSNKEFDYLNEGAFVFTDINERCDLLIDAYEDEEIPYEKLDDAIDVVQKDLAKATDPDGIMGLKILLEMLELAKKKKTLLAMYF